MKERLLSNHTWAGVNFRPVGLLFLDILVGQCHTLCFVQAFKLMLEVFLLITCPWILFGSFVKEINHFGAMYPLMSRAVTLSIALWCKSSYRMSAV